VLVVVLVLVLMVLVLMLLLLLLLLLLLQVLQHASKHAIASAAAPGVAAAAANLTMCCHQMEIQRGRPNPGGEQTPLSSEQLCHVHHHASPPRCEAMEDLMNASSGEALKRAASSTRRRWGLGLFETHAPPPREL